MTYPSSRHSHRRYALPPICEEADRIGHTQIDELAVREGQSESFMFPVAIGTFLPSPNVSNQSTQV